MANALRESSRSKKVISHYIVRFYNYCRLHSTLGYLSLNEFEMKNTEFRKTEIIKAIMA